MEKYTKEFIISEVKKIQYLYGLKKEIRYARERIQDDLTESVAEHVYGMHICALYFLPLENPDQTWDLRRIYEIISLHDIDEIETGDVLGYLKTDDMRAAEAQSMRLVLAKSPEHMQKQMDSLIDEYEAQETPESRFVKAIDKFEPIVHLYNELGKRILNMNKTTAEQSLNIKLPYMKDFPVIRHFTVIMQEVMVAERFFHTKINQ